MWGWGWEMGQSKTVLETQVSNSLANSLSPRQVQQATAKTCDHPDGSTRD